MASVFAIGVRAVLNSNNLLRFLVRKKTPAPFIKICKIVAFNMFE